MNSTISSPRPRAHLTHVWLRAVAAILLALCGHEAARAQLTFGASVSAVPANATAGGSVTVSASRLSGTHTYSVVLVPISGGAETPLFTQTTSADSLRRNVTLPALAVGKYALTLRSDGSTLDTASFGVVTKLSVALTPSSARPGASVAFTVSGLKAGRLRLDYDGEPVFGPAPVSSGNFSGKFRVPSDHAAPATITVSAVDIVGDVTPRVGSASFAAQAANTSPFTAVLNPTPSTTSPRLRDKFNVSGQLQFNESAADDVSISQYWLGSDGSVIPAGGSSFTLQSNGSFVSAQRAPQFGTMSAAQAAGGGRMMTVTRFVDANGVPQFTSMPGAQQMTTVLDVDQTVDVNIFARTPQGASLQHVRVDLTSAFMQDLFYPPGQTVTLMDGSHPPVATQYNDHSQAISQEGCPTGVERQYTDASGRAEFEFARDPPAGGYDGGLHSLHEQLLNMTIPPSVECVDLPDGTGGVRRHCREVDPAGLTFTLTIRAAHLGYGYRDDDRTEQPVIINGRVDRYTSSIRLEVCRPGATCVTTNYPTGSANVLLNLPQLPNAGVDLDAPYLKADVNDPGIPGETANSAGTYEFAAIANLSRLKNSATFVSPTQRPLRFQYAPGAGAPLASARLYLKDASGTYQDMGPFTGTGAGSVCTNPDATQTFSFPLQANLLRFPSDRWPSAKDTAKRCGRIDATDADGKTGSRKFCLNWTEIPAEVRSLSALQVDDRAPRAVKISGLTSAAGGATHSPSPPAEYHVGARDNSLGAGASITACVPTAQVYYCEPVTGFSQQHEQFSENASPQTQINYGNGAVSQGDGDWHTLFDYSVPLFRWYWGVPELLSAEVFADLGLKAQSYLDLYYDPAHPDRFRHNVGGAFSAALFIGVDIDVLFGILVDAGAMITGAGISAITTNAADNTNACFQFRMDFTGWLEIGCPVPNFLDPTCYIPDIEESFNIIKHPDNGSCTIPDSVNALTSALHVNSANGTRPPPVDPITPEERRALYRHPAIAFDTDGNGLALWLDLRGQLVSTSIDGDDLGDTKTISTGWGIRDVAVAYLGPQRAVAVWAENTLSGPPFQNSTLANKVRNQRLRWATWNGSAWSPVNDLTTAGKGEGQVRLGRCVGNILQCPRNGKVRAVWQRNTSGDMYAASMHVFTAEFNGTGWTPAQQVDQSGSLNITPTLTYLGGEPVIGWVRYNPGTTLSDISARRFAYRQFDGTGVEHVDTNVPAGLAAPSLASDPDGGLGLAFTLADANTGFIGTRQALHLAHATCSGGSCNFSAWRMHDWRGRGLYVERPQLLVDAAGDAVVTARGVGFDSGNPPLEFLADDPPGMRSMSGDLIQVRSALQEGNASLLSLSRDGATHFQPASALNPVSGDVVAISVNLPTPTTLALELEPTSTLARAPRAAVRLAAADGVEVTSTSTRPDLRVASINSTSSALNPGGNLLVTVIVQNDGSAWTPDADRTAKVKLWWDHPSTRAINVLNTTIPAIGAGARRTFILSMPVPSAFFADERQTLRATIQMSADAFELDGENNETLRAFGGMPMPKDARVMQMPGTRTSNLLWTLSSDTRVKGYRIYVEGADGKIEPLGSSFNAGFVDLAAAPAGQRRYYVSTYSARGVESELVGPLIAEPWPSVDDGLFIDGFDP